MHFYSNSNVCAAISGGDCTQLHCSLALRHICTNTEKTMKQLCVVQMLQPKRWNVLLFPSSNCFTYCNEVVRPIQTKWVRHKNACQTASRWVWCVRFHLVSCGWDGKLGTIPSLWFSCAHGHATLCKANMHIARMVSAHDIWTRCTPKPQPLQKLHLHPCWWAIWLFDFCIGWTWYVVLWWWLTFRLLSFANSPATCHGLHTRVLQILGLCPCSSPAIGRRSHAVRASSWPND